MYRILRKRVLLSFPKLKEIKQKQKSEDCIATDKFVAANLIANLIKKRYDEIKKMGSKEVEQKDYPLNEAEKQSERKS